MDGWIDRGRDRVWYGMVWYGMLGSGESKSGLFEVLILQEGDPRGCMVIMTDG